MAASPETKITFKITGVGADPNPPVQPDPQPVTPTPGSADTGFFTAADGFSVGSVVFCALLCFAIIFAACYTRSIAAPKMQKRGISRSFRLKDSKGIFKKFGIFALLFVAAAITLPNLMPESESASALIPEGSKTVELTAGANGSLDAQVTLSGETGVLAYATETLTCAASCVIYISTATTNNNLPLEGSTTSSISAMSGTKAALTANTWGYATGISSTPSATSKVWSVIPAKGDDAKVSDTLEAKTNFDITFGAYVNNTIPAGNYTNTVVYTAVSPV